MKHFFQIIFSILLFVSCKNDTCINQSKLTELDQPDLILKLNYNQPQDSLIQDIKKHFEEDICWKEKTIGLQINNRILKTIFLETCIMKGLGYGMRAYSEVRILLNQEGEILINETYFADIDTLGNWIGKNFPIQIEERLNLEEISLLWDEKTPKEKIEEVLLQIEAGYLKSYERISHEKFNKPICDLNEIELAELKKELDFKIKLGFGKIIPPIPPPPSDEEIENNFMEY